MTPVTPPSSLATLKGRRQQFVWFTSGWSIDIISMAQPPASRSKILSDVRRRLVQIWHCYNELGILASATHIPEFLDSPLQY